MIAVIATITVSADRVEEFEAVARELEAKVKANEPGCLLYCMAKSVTDPLTYRNMELFRDQAAIDEHIKKDYFVAATVKMRPCVSAPSVVEFMQTIA